MGNPRDKEETARRKVLKGLVDLRNIHKIASVVIWVTKSGTGFFGTDLLREKAKKAFDCTCACSCGADNMELWQKCLENDETDLENTENYFDPGMDILDFTELENPIPRLPIKLELMVYNELLKWLRPQIKLNRKERGFKGSKIVYKDMSWCPSFWPSDICDWMEVSNFSHWEASEYTGNGDLTFVLKRAVENRLEEKGLRADDYVSVTVDKKKQKRKEKWRGTHTNPEVDRAHVAERNDRNNDDENDEDYDDDVFPTFLGPSNYPGSSSAVGNSLPGPSLNSPRLPGAQPMRSSVITTQTISSVELSARSSVNTSPRSASDEALGTTVIPSPPLSSGNLTPRSSVPILGSVVPPIESSYAANDFQLSSRPKPKRLRPSELNNPELYQETMRSQQPPSFLPSSSRAGQILTRRTSGLRQTSVSSRWSVTTNVRNLTTGSLALGELPILVSPELVERFMEISSENSSNKIETGGLLAGIIVESSRYQVTHLIIPKQKGRSDYWEALNEVDIQEYFFSQELLLLGCIHTHPPPWTSFLSSVDLHQLFDFQKDNPSSVSIVIAPAHMPSHVPAYGYSLTDMGLTVLSECRKTGVHQHRERSRAGHELYREARHLIWSSDLTLICVDLRLEHENT